MDMDSDAIWISSVSGNFVTRFNITAKAFDLNLTGFDRPLGIEVDDSKVYVAENSEHFSRISVIDKTTYQISLLYTGAPILHNGPFYVLKSTLGNLWWTDNSKHFGYIIPETGSCVYFNSISDYNYFMTEIPGNTILFSCKGSVLVGTKEDIDTSGDLDKDGKVSMGDVMIVVDAFGSTPGKPNWNPVADIDKNNRVSMGDIMIVLDKFGKVYK
jgi:hypothetical protein